MASSAATFLNLPRADSSCASVSLPSVAPDASMDEVRCRLSGEKTTLEERASNTLS